MTTGNTVDDRRYSITDSNGYPATVGSIWTKQWSGGDLRLPRPPRGAVLVFDPRLATRHKKWRTYKPPANRPPKRALNEEHPYDVYASYLGKAAVTNVQTTFPYSVYYGPIGGGLLPGGLSDAWSADDQYKLLGKLRDQIGGSDFNLAVFLAEGNEALSMIAETARRLSKSISYARRGDFLNTFRVLLGNSRNPPKRFRIRVPDREIAARWLELQYGWLPLLKDIRGGAEFLAHNLNVPLQQVVRVSRRRLISDQPPSFGSWSYIDFELATRSQIKAIIAEVDVPQLLGLTDPASVLWEKLPWSFVADWAIPISSWLQSRGLQQALRGTFVQTTKTWYQGVGIKSLDPNRYFISSGNKYVDMWAKETRLHRSVSTTLDVPLPSFKPLGKVASWGHAANAVALLTQAFKK